jgi:hypothetical protein
MQHTNTLIISRYHDDIANPIYGAYFRGIMSQCPRTFFIDYFNLIGDLGIHEAQEEMLRLIEKENITLIFFIFVSGDPILEPRFIQRVAQERFIAMVFWDSEQFFEQIDRYYAQLADVVLLPSNDEYLYKLKALGINALCPFSLFDATKYKALPSLSKTIDVSFVGEVTKGKRQEYIRYLEENGIAIQAYGNGTKNGKVSFEKVVEIFNASKINLSFTGTYANDVYSFCSNINNRILQNKGKPIEVALCGGFVLSEYVPSLERVFEPHSIDTFQSKEELLEKIRYYLEHEEKRQEMAMCSHEYAKMHYDSLKAFELIFQHIQTHAPKAHKTLILDDIFIKIHTTFHVFYLISFLIQKKFDLAWKEVKLIARNKTFNVKDVWRYVTYEFFYAMQLYRIRQRCFALCEQLKNEAVVIYGAGAHTLYLYENIKPFKKLRITAVADANSALWGNKLHGIPIIPPHEIPHFARHVIISSFAFEEDIYKYLEHLLGQEATLHKVYDRRFSRGITSIKRIDPYQTYRDMLKFR